MAGQWIEIAGADAQAFRGYLAVPDSGSGPGLLLLQEIFGVNQHMRDVADLYAQEGYVVLAPDLFWRLGKDIELGYDEAGFGQAMGYFQALDVDAAIVDAGAALATLRKRAECQGGVGALGFCLGGKLAYLVAARHKVECAIAYYGVGVEHALDEAQNIQCPMVFHFAEKDKYCPAEARAQIEAAFAGKHAEFWLYPGVDHAFNAPERAAYDKPASLMAHTRTLHILHDTIGPRYNLSALWEQHIGLEFAARDADATMKTMVAQPYVNHVPTMTGGVGYTELLRFYKYHFIPTTPEDTKLIPISRTIGTDRLVDEFVFCCTHDVQVDWLLPGVEPTGKYIEVPMLAVVRFRGDKLYNEHIYWDQASVLVQAGLLEVGNLPIAGIATAKKLLDESLPSNTMLARWATSA